MDQTDIISSWISTIGNFGFPVSITVYLLSRFFKKIDQLEQAIQSNNFFGCKAVTSISFPKAVVNTAFKFTL